MGRAIVSSRALELPPVRRPQGFAAMVARGERERVVALASRGGRASHLRGAHEWTPTEARAARARRAPRPTTTARRAGRDATTPLAS